MDDDTFQYLSNGIKKFKNVVVKMVRKQIINIEENWRLWKSKHKLGHSLMQIFTEFRDVYESDKVKERRSNL